MDQSSHVCLKIDWRLLTKLFLVGLGLRVVVAALGAPISHDAAMFYLPNARVLVEGGFGAWADMNINVPVLFPMLVALVHPLLGDLEASALAISAVSASLMVFPVYALARFFIPHREIVHRFSAIIACVQPFSIRYGADARGDALFALLFTVAVHLAIGIWRRPSPGRSAIFGMLLGLSYLIRPESLGLAALLGLATVVEMVRLRRRTLPVVPYVKAVATAGVLSILALAPSVAVNMYVVHEKIAIWTLSAKAAALQEFDKGTGDSLGALNEERTMTLHEERLSSPGDLKGYSPLRLLLEKPGIMLKSFGRNIWEFIKTFPEALGYINCLLCVLGLWCFRGRMRPGSLIIIGAVFGFYGSVLSTFYISKRFWLWLLPLAIPICGSGAAWVALTLYRRRRLAPVWLAGCIMLATAVEGGRHNLERGTGWFSSVERRLGDRISDLRGRGQKFVSAKGRVAFYASGVNLPLPSNPLEDIVVYMENRSASLLVIDRARLSRPTRRPQLIADLDAHPRFELVASESNGGRQLECYILNPL